MMEDLFNLIVVDGDLLATIVNMFLVGFSLDFVLNIAALISEAKR